jgi:hypothetical protein
LLKTRHLPHIPNLVLVTTALLASLFLLACGGGSDLTKQQDGIKVEVANGAPATQSPNVFVAPSVQAPGGDASGTVAPPATFAPLPTSSVQSVQATPAPAASTPTTTTNGGKPATPPSTFSATPVPTAVIATAKATMDGTSAPTTGRWIDVDVSRYQVRLMSGTEATRTFAPVAVGAQVDSGAYESTQTGTFRVHNKIAGLQYDAPYKTYISDWVGFDAARANGFHSLLKDAIGNVVDPATGRVSNGCIRVADSAAVFAYAEIGMVVYVHS